MGVPAFFKWLVNRFPKIVVDAIEDDSPSTDPNPNGEYDNLYLDMNGIIHPCTHPEGREAPKTTDDMMKNIMDVVDRLFNIVRPRNLLYLAIDGVAPRAKMNQQRSRRFRAAYDAKMAKLAAQKVREDMIAMGKEPPPEPENTFDSNCITPGTEFMAEVSRALKFYVTERLQNDPAWKGIKVILSDSNVPGEGEHKIMQFIRAMRAQKDYNPNTRHVICGLDADLIMLSLATHEPHFSILREMVIQKDQGVCFKCHQRGHKAVDCPEADTGLGVLKKPASAAVDQPYQFLHVNILRECLENWLTVEHLPFEFDLERAIDDWVFLCFFVGNDFLPHLPTLEIREDAIGVLTALYKKILPRTGYLTENGNVNLDRVQILLHEISLIEDAILVKRLERDRLAENRRKMRERQQQAEQYRRDENIRAAEKMRAALTGEPPQKRMKVEEKEKEKEAEVREGDARLGEAGWKERYYNMKFGKQLSDYEFLNRIGSAYIEGLVWVFRYYYQGCCSWGWYFPYYYAPFASEMCNVTDANLDFPLGEPVKPLEQLMSVLPEASSAIVPFAYRPLMKEDSTIGDFYPTTFKIDLNGKPKELAWLGVVLLPFVDAKRLHDALAPLEDQLTAEEKARNVVEDDVLFVHTSHPLAQLDLLKDSWIDIDPAISPGLFGQLKFHEHYKGKTYYSPVEGLPDIQNCQVVCARYRNPVIPEGTKVGCLLPGVKLPPKKMQLSDFEERRPYQIQNAAANRMINHYAGPKRQEKPSQERPSYGPQRTAQPRHTFQPYDRHSRDDRSGYREQGRTSQAYPPQVRTSSGQKRGREEPAWVPIPPPSRRGPPPVHPAQGYAPPLSYSSPQGFPPHGFAPGFGYYPPPQGFAPHGYAPVHPQAQNQQYYPPPHFYPPHPSRR